MPVSILANVMNTQIGANDDIKTYDIRPRGYDATCLLPKQNKTVISARVAPSAKT